MCRMCRNYCCPPHGVAVKRAAGLLNQSSAKRPIGGVKTVQSGQGTTAAGDRINGALVAGSPKARRPVKNAVCTLYQTGGGTVSCSVWVKVVQIGEASGRTNPKDDAGVVHAPVVGCAIEIAVAGQREWGIGTRAVGSVEA